jgi:hypothetical protein
VGDHLDEEPGAQERGRADPALEPRREQGPGQPSDRSVQRGQFEAATVDAGPQMTFDLPTRRADGTGADRPRSAANRGKSTTVDDDAVGGSTIVSPQPRSRAQPDDVGVRESNY